MTQTTSPSHRCAVEQKNYRGWRAVRLANGIVELFVVPEIGGRVVQLSLGGSDFFYVNPRHVGRSYRPEENNFDSGWKNYGGSKVWPAPQGWSSDAEWPGPPDPILDGGAYSCEILEQRQETAAIRLESPPDEYTGLTFSRVIRIFQGSASVEVHHTMRNTGARGVRWSIWQVTQQPANADLAISWRATTYHQLFGDQPYGHVTLDRETRLCKLRYMDQVAKLATKPEQGWAATLDSRRGTALVETFPLFPSLTYPDDAPLELWVNGHGSFTAHGDTIEMARDPNGCDAFIETEILSPLVELEPGDEYCFRTSWRPTSIKADAIVSVNDCAAIGRPLRTERQGRNVIVTGSFGLLRAGKLELASISRSGRVNEVRTLGPATTLSPCKLECSIPFRPDLSRVSLRLRNSCGSLLGTLDGAVIY
jgi:hypothetical protein